MTTIAEPQQGGSQVMLADLAVGLTEHGHDVDVYAAAGSVIPGAHVVATGIESATMSDALIRHGRPRRSLGRLADAYDHVFGMVERGAYDVVHSHGFDPPALRRARAGGAPIIHTVHLPPEPEAAAALREAQQGREPGIVVGVSTSQAQAWSPLVRFDRVIANGVPVDRMPWSDQPGRGLIFAGRLSPEKGAAVAIRDRAQVRRTDRPLRDCLRRGLRSGPPPPPRRQPAGHVSRRAAPGGAVAQVRVGPRRALPDRLG